MCGIAGFFETHQSRSRLEIHAAGQAMTNALVSRGPDGEGGWQDPDLLLYLGHRRLSVIDLTETGSQPMESSSGRYIVTYNGEIYNFRELAAELAAPLKGTSDTEVMLAAFEKWGFEQALQRFEGMFAFVLWDRSEGRLHLVRDRLGKKPLYIGWAGKTLLFASELKALRAHPDFRAVTDRRALTLYMRYACVPAPYCIFENVWQLLPGNRLTLDLRALEAGTDLAQAFEPYWHHPRIVERAGRERRIVGEAQAVDEFENLLESAVKKRMVSDVPLGAFLSGGIDSGAVTALMRKTSPQPVKTFCIGFEEQGFDEAAHARKIADHLGTDHHELYLGPRDALDVIPKLPEIYDEPFADISQIPSFLISRFARREVTVALTGDGGDEMLGGYQRHYIVPALWKRLGWLPRPVRAAMACGMKALSAESWSRLVPQRPQFGEGLYKVAELLSLGGPEEVYRRLVSQWPDPEALVIAGEEPEIPLTSHDWQPEGLSFAERMMYGDALSYLPNDILTKLDRAAMACSLEARAPLLDVPLFEYVWGLPLKMKVRGGQGKWLLRQVLKRHVPVNLFERPKQGFTVPVGAWLRGPLKDWAENLLDAKRLGRDGFLDPAPVRHAWEDHLKGRGRNAHKLWTVLMFQSWRDRWG